MAATYEIVNIVDRTVSLGGGQFQNQERVTYQTKPSGLVGYVDIPAEPGWENTVDEIVTAEAAKREQVKAL